MKGLLRDDPSPWAEGYRPQASGAEQRVRLITSHAQEAPKLIGPDNLSETIQRKAIIIVGDDLFGVGVSRSWQVQTAPFL